MDMYYQLWDLAGGNRIADFRSEAEGLAMVRELLVAGWSVEDLALGAFAENGDSGDLQLPPVLCGAELADRAAPPRRGSVPA